MGTWLIYLLWSVSAWVVITSVAKALKHTHPLAEVKRSGSRAV
jgi:hypothetical protein